jgi:hypothetical protein
VTALALCNLLVCALTVSSTWSTWSDEVKAGWGGAKLLRVTVIAQAVTITVMVMQLAKR